MDDFDEEGISLTSNVMNGNGTMVKHESVDEIEEDVEEDKRE